MREWAGQHGRPPGYDEWKSPSPGAGRPPSRTIERRFGSWNAAIASAGLEPLRRRRRGGRPLKIPPSAYPLIVERLSAGEMQASVARDYGVSQGTISQIKRRVERDAQQEASG
jgi:hypothetical protein